MRVIDISRPIISGMPVWPGDPAVSVTAVARLDEGAPANVSALVLGTHTGTHVDPPAHFFDGAATVDQLPLDVLVGEALVVDAAGPHGPLGPAELERLEVPAGTDRLLLRTGGGSALSGAGAAWLVDRAVRLVGIDSLSIDAAGAEGYPAHRALLGAAVVIIEGLDLSAAAPGRYTLAALPLRITGGDGAPARVVLIALP